MSHSPGVLAPAPSLQQSNLRQIGVVAGTWLLCCLLLLGPALLNGFPLVFFDSGTYLANAFEGSVAPDRPIWYAKFLWLLRPHWSVWLPLFGQALLATYAIDAFLRAVCGAAATPRLRTVAVAVLCVGTGLPWMAGQWMPDIFSGVLIVALAALLAAGERLHRRDRLLLPALIVVCCAVHVSHPLIAAACIAVAGATVAWRHGLRAAVRTVAGATVATALGVALLLLPNLARNGQLALTPASNVMLLAKLIDQGAALAVLEARCPAEPLPICPLVPALQRARMAAIAEGKPVGTTSDMFLWDGPLDALGGFKAVQPYASSINRAAVAQELPTIALGAASGFAQQLVTFRIGDGLVPYAPREWVSQVIGRQFPARAVARFNGSLQQQGRLSFAAVNVAQAAALAGSLVALALAWQRRVLPAAIRGATALLLVGFVANAAVTGALSAVHDRYGSRAVWVVVLAGVSAGWLLWQARRTTSPSPS